MKKSIFFALLLLASSSLFAQTKLKVGTVDGGVKNAAIMTKFFTQTMQLQGMLEKLDKISIQRYRDETGKPYYMVQSQTKNANRKIGIIVFPEGKYLYLTAISLKRGTVTCSGCTNGCLPHADSQLKYYCGDACHDCRKKVTSLAAWKATPDPVRTFINYFN